MVTVTAVVGVTGCAVVVYVVSPSDEFEQHKRHKAIGVPMRQLRATKPKEIENPKTLPREEVKCKSSLVNIQL